MRPSRNMATMMGATSMMQCDESCGGGKGVGLGLVRHYAIQTIDYGLGRMAHNLRQKGPGPD